MSKRPVSSDVLSQSQVTSLPAQRRILTAEEWLSLPAETEEANVTIGSGSQPIVRVRTKNLVEAPEKAFKTTFLLRLTLGMSCGKTVFQSLPVLRPRRILYLHGELSGTEIQERTRAAVVDLPRPLGNFFQERTVQAHLIEQEGQKLVRRFIEEVLPEDVCIDPWQSLIAGFDENLFKDVSRALKFLDSLIDDYGITLHVATHCGKDRTRGTRGHSVLAGWRDTLIKLERKGDYVDVNVDPRWAAPVPPFKLEFSGSTLKDSGHKVSSGKQAEKIREVVVANCGQASREAVGEALGLTNNALRQALKRAADSGAVKLEDGQVTLSEDTRRDTP